MNKQNGHWRSISSPTLQKQLRELLPIIKEDRELDVQIRNNYVNIYYKGGNILRIKPHQRFEFDKFYFYTDAEKDKPYTRKTNIVKAADTRSRFANELTSERAKEIIEQLDSKKKNLLQLRSSNPSAYFNEAKKVMDQWFNAMKGIKGNTEKEIQHKIALCNKDFQNSDLIVIDVEYEVSQHAPYAKKGTNPRPDIIAIDKDGRIHVIELKYEFKSDKGKAGIGKHLEDFKETIKKDADGDFKDEMENLMQEKMEYGLLSQDKMPLVSKEKDPVFDIAFYYENANAKEIFEKKYECYKEQIGNVYFLTTGSLYLKNV